MFLGDAASKYAWVDRFMDSTAPIRGYSHRADPVHNPFLIYAISGFDVNAYITAVLHYVLDVADTEAKRKIMGYKRRVVKYG
ncbi:MAG: hypothetical protein QXO47_10060 [Thermoproteota archaeon]